jgi:RNA polymerase sigma factor (sigma-70 family)
MPVARQAAVAEVPGLNAILNGDYDRGWAEFYNNYLPTVTNQVVQAGIGKTLEGGAEAEEIAHEVMTNLVRNGSAALKGIREKTDAGMRAYFRTVVRNRHIDLIREKVQHRDEWGQAQPDTDEEGWQTFTEEELVAGYVGSRYPRPDELVEFKDIAHRVPGLLDALPPQYARILGMLTEGMNQPQIANELGVNLSSVGNRVRRAWTAARKLLKTMNPQLSEELFPETT